MNHPGVKRPGVHHPGVNRPRAGGWYAHALILALLTFFAPQDLYLTVRKIDFPHIESAENLPHK